MQPRTGADLFPMSARALIRTLATLLTAGALTVAVSACGSGSPSATLDPIAQAADATTHSGGAQIAMTMTVSGSALPSALTAHINGDFNMSTQEGEMFFDMAGLPSGTPLGSEFKATELYKGGVIYLSSPAFEGKLPGGAKWMKLDLVKFESTLGINLQSLSSGQTSPAQLLQYLKGSGGGATVAGHEAVRGTQTTRYEGTIDLEKVAEEIPSTNRDQLKATVQKLTAATGGSFPVTVWIDEKHLVRRMKMRMPYSADGQNGTVEIDYEMFDFGPTPGVNAPSDGETYDGTSLATQGFSASGG